jgi:hypothetical protein
LKGIKAKLQGGLTGGKPIGRRTEWSKTYRDSVSGLQAEGRREGKKN